MKPIPYLVALEAAASSLEASARTWLTLESTNVTLIEFLLIDARRKGFMQVRKGLQVLEAYKNNRAHPSMMGGPIVIELQKWADTLRIDLSKTKITPKTKTEVLVTALMGRPCTTTSELQEVCHVSKSTARTWLAKMTASGMMIRRCVGNTDYFFMPGTVNILRLIAAGFAGRGERPTIESVLEIFARKVEITFPPNYGIEGFVEVKDTRNLGI